MMRFEALNKFENQTLETTTKLVNLRRNNLALVYGDFQLVTVTDTQFIYKRKYFSNEVIVAFNKGASPATINLGKLAGNVKANFSSELQLQNQETILTLLPYSFEIITIDLN
jgi:glycosidase